MSVTATLAAVIFISPAGQLEPWMLNFVEYPSIVERFLPPMEGRDIGVYVQGDTLDQGRLKIWLGAWNGAHRMIAAPGGINVPAYDPYGNGVDNDSLAGMARVQLNLLDEESYFLMFSGGWERNRVTYFEQVSPGVIISEGKDDTLYNAAAEFKFDQLGDTYGRGVGKRVGILAQPFTCGQHRGQRNPVNRTNDLRRRRCRPNFVNQSLQRRMGDFVQAQRRFPHLGNASTNQIDLFGKQISVMTERGLEFVDRL